MLSLEDLKNTLSNICLTGHKPRTVVTTVHQLVIFMQDQSLSTNYSKLEGMRVYGIPLLLLDSSSKDETEKMFQKFNFVSVTKKDAFLDNNFVCGAFFSKQGCFVLFN